MLNQNLGDMTDVQYADPQNASSMFGTGSYMDYNPAQASPLVRIRAKFAQAKADAERENRLADQAGLPAVLQDIDERIRTKREQMAQMESVMAQASGDVPQQPGVQNLQQSDMIAAALAALTGDPNALNQVVPLLQGRRQQEAQVGYENQLAQYQQNERLRQENQRRYDAMGQDVSGLEDSRLKVRLAGIDSQQNQMDAERAHRYRLDELNARNDSQEVKDARKTLNDPKSTRAARAGALAVLDDYDKGYSPSVKQDYLDSTYYEDNVRANTANVGARTETENALRQPKVDKVAAEIESIKSRTGLSDSQKALLDAKLEYVPLEYKAKLADVWSRITKRESSGSSKGGGSHKGGGGREDNLSWTDIGRALKVYNEIAKKSVQNLSDFKSQLAYKDAIGNIQRLEQAKEALAKYNARPDVPNPAGDKPKDKGGKSAPAPRMRIVNIRERK